MSEMTFFSGSGSGNPDFGSGRGTIPAEIGTFDLRNGFLTKNNNTYVTPYQLRALEDMSEGLYYDY